MGEGKHSSGEVRDWSPPEAFTVREFARNVRANDLLALLALGMIAVGVRDAVGGLWGMAASTASMVVILVGSIYFNHWQDRRQERADLAAGKWAPRVYDDA